MIYLAIASFILLCILCLFMTNKQNHKQIPFTFGNEERKLKKKTQLELYQQFGEECLLDCGIPLENVLIKPHYENNGGVAFRRRSFSDIEFNLIKRKYTAKQLSSKLHYSNTFEFNKIYLILPEIVDQYTLHVWLHEIGHYMQHYYEGYKSKPSFVEEYQAEMYANTIIKFCPIEEKKSYWTEDFNKHYFNIDLQYNINSGRRYVQSHLEKAKYLDLCFMTPEIQNYLDTEVVLYHEKEDI